jgi:hypothetical protein
MGALIFRCQVRACTRLDCDAIILTTNNGFGNSNRIVLEPEVLEALNRYVDRLQEGKR